MLSQILFTFFSTQLGVNKTTYIATYKYKQPFPSARAKGILVAEHREHWWWCWHPEHPEHHEHQDHIAGGSGCCEVLRRIEGVCEVCCDVHSGGHHVRSSGVVQDRLQCVSKLSTTFFVQVAAGRAGAGREGQVVAHHFAAVQRSDVGAVDAQLGAAGSRLGAVDGVHPRTLRAVVIQQVT